VAVFFLVIDITFKYVPLVKAKNANLWKYFGFKSVFLCTVCSVIAAHTTVAQARRGRG